MIGRLALDWFPTPPELGRVELVGPGLATLSLPGAPVRRVDLREIGIFIATLHRPEYDADGLLKRMRLIWTSITHNERVDVGAAIQANLVFGTSGTTANGVLTAVAVASAALTKTHTDLSLGSASGAVTTNEFTTIGLSRATGTVSTYTAPASLGATFSQLVTKAFSVTGTGTAQGGGLFDKVVVASSNLYVEDNFSSSANVLNGDTLTENVTVSN